MFDTNGTVFLRGLYFVLLHDRTLKQSKQLPRRLPRHIAQDEVRRKVSVTRRSLSLFYTAYLYY